MVVVTKAVEGEVFVSLFQASKFYGSYAALKDVSIKLVCGEVHMLLGENGAGKSTLVSLLTGTNKLDGGTRTVRGADCPSLSPLDAREAGINTVLQDFGLAPTLTAAENYALGRERTKAACSTRRGCGPTWSARWRSSVFPSIPMPVSIRSRGRSSSSSKSCGHSVASRGRLYWTSRRRH